MKLSSQCCMVITDDCISCDVCMDECPVEAISEGEEKYIIDQLSCNCCVGVHDEPVCVALCPVDAIVNGDCYSQ